MQTTPSQKAIAQFIESLIITAIIAGLVSASALLTGTGAINWQEVGVSFGLAFAFSLAHGFTAYIKNVPSPDQAQSAALSSTLDALITEIQRRTGLVSASIQASTSATPSNIKVQVQQPDNNVAPVAQSQIQPPDITATQIPVVQAPAQQ